MIRATFAALLIAAFGLTFGGSSAIADEHDPCQTNPQTLLCLSQAAEQACLQNGPNSNECLSARNAYLQRLVEHQHTAQDSFLAQIATHLERIAKLEQKVERQAATIKRLRDRLG